MRNLLLDVWHDLRQKRLWPVAALLLVGLVAVPVIVAKPAKRAAPVSEPAPGAAASTSARDALQVQVAQSDGSGSKLDVFAPKDPFRPPSALLAAEKASAGTAPAGSSTAAGASTSSSPSTGGGTTTASSNGTGGGGTGGGGNSGGIGGGNGEPGGGNGGGRGEPGGGSGDSTQPAPTAPPDTVVKRIAYVYVADVTFERQGRSRRIRALRRLDMLPSEHSPLFIFMGVSVRGTRAVFLTDSTLRSTAGEGRCNPGGPQCGVLSLEAGEEELLVGEDGTTYLLRIEQIRRVRVSTASKARATRPHKPRPSTHRAARRVFSAPLLSDLEVVSSAMPARSSRDRAHR
jgi:hypothetical protein